MHFNLHMLSTLQLIYVLLGNRVAIDTRVDTVQGVSASEPRCRRRTSTPYSFRDHCTYFILAQIAGGFFCWQHGQLT